MLASLRSLRNLVAAADSGSLTEAARRLGVSQPSVSAAIAEVETALGATLFVRHHARGVSLTAGGARVVSEARLLLKHADDFERSALELGGAVSGEVAVGCFLTLAPRFMPWLLAAFARRHPGVSVNLIEGDQEEIIAGLRGGHSEIALSYSFGLSEEIAVEPLAELAPRAIVGSQHRLAGRGVVSLRELAEEPYVMLDLPLSRDYFAGLFRSCGIEPRVVFRSRSFELIRGLVGRGRGYTIQNAVPRTPTTYDGGLVAALALSEPLPPVRVVALTLARQPTRPAVRAFAELLRDAFAEGEITQEARAP